MKTLNLFDPNASDSKETRKIWGGECTGLIQLNNVKYPKALAIYKLMLNNFWIPEKYDLTEDLVSIRKLSPEEKRAFSGTLCYLTFLDSIQVSNLSFINIPVTAPEVRIALSQHSFQETIHAASYQYIIESLYSKEERDGVFYWYQENPVLEERMSFIVNLYQQYINKSSHSCKTELLESYLVSLLANYLLEGLYFYTGFLFFYSLAERGLMLGTCDIIRLINRDEVTHVRLFQLLISEFLNDNPGGLDLFSGKNKTDLLINLVRQTTEMEIRWADYLYSGLPLFDKPTITQYCCFRANMLCKSIGLGLPYPNVPNHNPYHRLELISDTDPSKLSLKGNFFEGGVTNYMQSSSVKGWDLL